MKFHGTTVLALRHKGMVAMAGDGQVTMNDAIMKTGARKVRRIYQDHILCGFAGATADAFSLFEKLEAKLKEYSGNLLRASVEMAKLWRTDKYLRNLEALLIAADEERLLVISGQGDVIEPDDGIAAIGSGGGYALAAARALIVHSDLNAEGIARESIQIAAGICIYTNDQIIVEIL
ncbi:MAG TPA: ATP-dependent protease subunit HslV [Candidatus Sumerlaeota bacterium]|nr:ATP-dependent protease subunit HslV [Candidatus Sumerlaeota bacterium]